MPEIDLFTRYLNNTETHNRGAGVDTENRMKFLFRHLAGFYNRYELYVKLTISFLVLAFLVHTIYKKVDVRYFRWEVIREFNYTLILASLALTVVNWGLEGLKWKYLVRRETNMSLTASFKIVLEGLAMGFFTPGRAGDIVLRLTRTVGNQPRLFLATMINRFTQLCVTITLGLVALFFAFSRLDYQKEILLMAALALCAPLLLLVFLPRLFKWNWLWRRDSWKQAAGGYGSSDINNTFLLGVLRYLVFAFQYYLVCRAVGLDLMPSDIFAAIGLIFLLKSLSPFINMFGELGLRETAAIGIFTMVFRASAEKALLSSLLLWLINLCIPAVAGLLIFAFTRRNGTLNA